ncbi:pyocin [Pectobacterium carotovorum]|uniref:colicin-like bacteriocin tRNase domain-containing protein n=1 Tax=Pectobacterium carotovorum TaxID=554 RepID=UPI00191CD3CD|nr:colicin-like bacteriocin tRNase domain-containing protein [Pectobacterium carotovorum]MBL0906727.1 pyocin [Pectobacterium carotovorum]
MIKYRLYAPNDGDTMTVDGGGGGWVSNDDRKGGNDRNNDKGGSAVDYGKNPEKQTVINPYLFFAIPPAVYLIDDVWGFTFNTAAIEVGLKKVADFALKATPVAGRLVGILGAIMPSDIAPDSIDPVFNGMQQTKMAQMAAQLAAQKGVPNIGYSVTAMPADLVSSLPVSEISSLPTAPASLLAQSVINTELSRRQLTLTKPAVNAPVANIPVVKAEKTAVPGVYSVKVIADKPALQIKLDKTQPALAKNPPKVKDDVQVSSFLSSPVADTHHAFIDFGSDHEPVYVSLSKIVTAEEEKKQVEEAKRREQEWLLRHPITAAERKLTEIHQVLSFAQQLKESSTATISEKTKTVAVYQEQVNTAAKNRDNFYNQNRGLLSAGITGGPGYPIYLALWQTMNNFHQAYFRANNALEQESHLLNQARSDLSKAEQLLAENNLLQVETERMLAEEKEIKRNRVNVSTFGTVQTQLSTLLSAFYAATSGSTASISQSVPSGELASFLYKPQGMIGSGKIVGKDVDILFSIPVKDIPGYKSPTNLDDLAKKNGNLDLPIRLAFSDENGERVLRAFKAGSLRVPSSVRGVAGSYDKNTGIFSAEIDGVSSRLVLENPVFPPTGNVGNTGNTAPDYKALLNTGVDVKPVDKITVTITPVADPVDIDDYIIWLPTASGSGVEPIYVVFNSNPYGETNSKGKYSGRSFNTDKAGGAIQNLDWKTANIDRAGVDKVKLHTGRFAESDANKVMIDRLERILKGTLAVTDTDKRFYTHEIRELERYRNLGIKDGVVPSNQGEVWNNTHTATLEDYKINERTESLYTPEAIKASEEQDMRESQ